LPMSVAGKAVDAPIVPDDFDEGREPGRVWLVGRLRKSGACRGNAHVNVDDVAPRLQKAGNLTAIELIPVRLLSRVVPVYLHLPIAAGNQEKRGALGKGSERKFEAELHLRFWRHAHCILSLRPDPTDAGFIRGCLRILPRNPLSVPIALCEETH